MIKTFLHLTALFSALSISAFGGGKVVLPSMHQASVGEYHWMSNQQFVDLFSISMAAPAQKNPALQFHDSPMVPATNGASSAPRLMPM